jgi:hypothetical protein
MTGVNRLSSAGIVLFLVCALSGATQVYAQSATPRKCKPNSYPPVTQQCTGGTCIHDVPPTNVMTATDFQVTFTGIICIGGGSEADPPSPTRQAMMIHGNFFTKRHTPMLGVYGADKASLRKASGRSVKCDHTYCWTPIRGLRLRIVGDDDKPPVGGAVDEDPSFCDLVPRLASLLPKQASGSSGYPPMKYELCGDNEALPKQPVDGCFDIEGGTLMAYPFKSFQQGLFVFADGHQVGPLQFADVVAWHGQTIGTARLQIKSAATGSAWQTVKTKVDHVPLLIAAANLGHAHHTTTHFALNEKLYDHLKGHLPQILADGVPPCDPDRIYCYSSLTSLIDVVGCSNTRP